MQEVEDLIRRADAYAQRHDFAPTTVSKVLFKDSRRLEALRAAPERISLKTLAAARARMARLEANPKSRRRCRRTS